MKGYSMKKIKCAICKEEYVETYIAPTEKECKKCGEVKPLTEFYNQKSTKDGKRTQCKSCIDEYTNTYNKKNRKKLNEKARQFRQEHPEEWAGYREKRKERQKEKMQNDPFYVSRVHQSFSYKQRGIYVEQLQRYGEYFDKSQIHIIDTSRLFDSPHLVLQEAFSFLGVDPQVEIGDISVKNANPLKKDVPDQVYENLSRFFAPYNQKLSQQLGREFEWC